MILPGATLGMLGGGQLGRMFTVAARTMGYRVLVLDPDPLSPAGAIADEHIRAAYDDKTALEHMGRECQAVTTEFENVPAETLNHLAGFCHAWLLAGGMSALALAVAYLALSLITRRDGQS